jgi:predicted outer membrane repeat protein
VCTICPSAAQLELGSCRTSPHWRKPIACTFLMVTASDRHSSWREPFRKLTLTGAALCQGSCNKTIQLVPFRGTSLTAGNGGALVLLNSELTASNSSFKGNQACMDGGAVYASTSSLSFSTSSLVGNTVGAFSQIELATALLLPDLPNTLTHASTAVLTIDDSGLAGRAL